jgi:hypothetical protein
MLLLHSARSACSGVPRHRLALLLASVLFCLDTPPVHAAESGPWTFRWLRGPGAESCVADDELARQLHRATEADDIAPVPLTIEGTLTRDGANGVFHARLHVLDGRGETLGVRELTSSEPRCELLTPSIVLVLSILVELAAQPAAVAGQGEAKRPSESDAVSPREADSAKASAKRWWFEPSLALAMAMKLTVDISVGPALGLRVRSPWWLALVVRSAYFPRESHSIQASADGASVSTDLRASKTDLALCSPFFRHPVWWLAACGGATFVWRQFDVTALSGEPEAIPGRAASPLRQFAFGFDSTLQMGYTISQHWLVSVDLSLLVFQRPEGGAGFNSDAQFGQIIYRTPSIAGVFSWGIGARL